MLTQGEILRDRYRVIRQLGQGGMGAVYEAHDNVFDTSVALKQITINVSSAYDTKAQEMAHLAFEREAKILARVNHENIPHVKDYFSADGGQFLVMELVDGDDFGKMLNQRQSAFPIASVIEWTDKILDALEYLHAQSPPVIHRDIKPQNLKLTSRQKVKLLDFGIAKGTDAQSADTVTNQTFIAATLNYSPLEQMLRVLDPTFLAVITHKYSKQIDAILEQTADVTSDLYALGATIYHLATNTPPVEAIKRAIDIWDGKPDPIVYPTNLNPAIPQEFSEFLLKSMQIRREFRFATAGEMRRALRQIVESSDNPTLKQTVQLSSSQLSPDFTIQTADVPIQPPKTAEFGDLTTNKTEIMQDVTSLKTVSFADVDAIAPPSDPTIQRSNPSVPATSEFRPQNPSVEQQFGTGGRNYSANAVPLKKKSKAIWLLPIAFVLFLVIGGGAFGVWYMFARQSRSGIVPANANNSLSVNSNSNIANKPPNVGSGAIAESLSADDEMKTAISPEPTEPSDPQIPAQTPPKRAEVVKTPGQKPTPAKKATPKPKNLDCIFTDTCE